MPVSTGNDMIEGARKMYTWFSGHVQEVTKEGYVSILNYLCLPRAMFFAFYCTGA
jgi:hypothetical protein